jgi:hypothetical protein
MLCKEFNVLPSQIDAEDAVEIEKLMLIMQQKNDAEYKDMQRKNRKKPMKKPRRRR